ncbi:MAG: mevalonate kinase, partial [Streptococcus sp.]|nr:mevalonate kinase [Streptococcus sp.]
MKRKVGRGWSHSKIILIGEHSVVYGYPAIALPLKNVEVECQITASDSPLIFQPDDTLSTAIFSALEYLNLKTANIDYQITSTVPEKRGMGSSAAVSIAAISAVLDYFNQTVDKETLEQLANQAEIIAHTNPSGLDAKTCLSDHAIKFIRNVGFSQLTVNLDAYLIIADTGIHGQTKEAVKKVEAMEEKSLPILHRLGNLTEQMEQAISEKAVASVGFLMTKAHTELQKLGVSIEKADYLVFEALSSGALGAKMSGGGLGGCIIA